MVFTDDGQPVKSFAASTVATLSKLKHRKLSTILILCSCITDRGKDEANLEHKKGTEQPVLKSGFVGVPLSSEIPIFKTVHQPFSHSLTSHCFSLNFQQTEENNSAATHEGTQPAFVGSIFSTVLLTTPSNLLKTTKFGFQLKD